MGKLVSALPWIYGADGIKKGESQVSNILLVIHQKNHKMFDMDNLNTRCSGHAKRQAPYIVSGTVILPFSVCVDSTDALCGF